MKPTKGIGVKGDEWQEAPHGDEQETIRFCKKLAEKIEDILNLN